MLVRVVDDQAAQQGSYEHQDKCADSEPHPCRTLALLGLGVRNAVEVSQLHIVELVAESPHVVIEMMLIGWRKVAWVSGVGKTSSGRLLNGGVCAFLEIERHLRRGAGVGSCDVCNVEQVELLFRMERCWSCCVSGWVSEGGAEDVREDLEVDVCEEEDEDKCAV